MLGVCLLRNCQNAVVFVFPLVVSEDVVPDKLVPPILAIGAVSMVAALAFYYWTVLASEIVASCGDHHVGNRFLL